MCLYITMNPARTFEQMYKNKNLATTTIQFDRKATILPTTLDLFLFFSKIVTKGIMVVPLIDKPADFDWFGSVMWVRIS